MVTLEKALALHEKGFAVIPCRLTNLENGKVNKQPVIKWQEYQKIRPNRSLVEYWFGEKYKGYDIGAVTGGTHGYFVIDLDTGWSEEDRKKMNLTATLTESTPSGGTHLYYRHPGGTFLTKTKGGVLPHIDVRGDGGFIVMAPSTYPDGRKYEWINDLPIAIPSKETLAFVEDKQGHDRADFSGLFEGLPPGGRTDAAISIAGALLFYQPPHQWDTLCWPIVDMWNEQNNPPLDRLKLRKDFLGICARERSRRGKNSI